MTALQSILEYRDTPQSLAHLFRSIRSDRDSSEQPNRSPLKGVTIGGTSWRKTHTRAIAQRSPRRSTWPRQKPQERERSMCLSFPRRPPWPSRSFTLRVGTGSTACKENQWALDLEQLEVVTKEPGATTAWAWVVVEVIGEAVALHADARLPFRGGVMSGRGIVTSTVFTAHYLPHLRGRPRTSAAKFLGEQRPELQHPSSDRFVRDIQPAFGQQLFDIAEAEGKAKIQPHCVPDDVRRELVASKRDRCHSPSLGADPKTAKVSVSIPENLL
jgi:hypothetical protein